MLDRPWRTLAAFFYRLDERHEGKRIVEVLNEDGNVIAEGKLGSINQLTVPAGSYRVRFKTD